MPPLNDPKAEEYALHIQEIVSQLKKTSKKALAENEAYIVPPEVEDTEITLDFSSYHLYTSEDDKYDSYGYQPVSAKVTIDEENKKALLY